jgi:DNA topoisomerase-2
MSNFDDGFQIADFREHVQTKAMWSGKTSPIIIPDLLGLTSDNQLVELITPHTPALLKSIDEIIVNAIDHCVAVKKVKCIHVTVDNDKYITVYNDGPGIPIVMHSSGLYTIEIMFSKFLTGTNIKKPVDSIKGGINGLGAKIANVHSNKFIVETVYNKQKYTQIYTDRLRNIYPPILTNTTESEHTTIKFLPAYVELGDNNIEDLIIWLRLRMCQVAAYVGDKVEVKFNDQICKTHSTELLAKSIISNEFETVISTTCRHSINKHILSISAIVLPPGKKVKRKAGIQNMTIINGVVSTKGNHVMYFRKIIKDFIDKKMNKLIKGSTIETKDINIRLVICGAIPGIDWSGQNKEILQVSNDVLQGYKVPTSFLTEISELMLTNIATGQTCKDKIEHDKYIKARNISNSKLRKNCMLLAAEGDSAITLLRTGLTQKCNKKADKSIFVPSFDWLGIISLQGVIINAAKETVEYGELTIRSDKLRNNKRLNMLADAFGLRYDYTYLTQIELNTLNYDKLIICTDQDLDGTGKICSLVLVWIYTFWPELIKQKRIGKLMTPVIRVHIAKSKLEFYYENEFSEWLKQTNINDKYKVKFYKGLATHDANEAEDMFTLHNFNKNIYIYTLDDISHTLFNIYFGPDPSLRRTALITPVQYLTIEETLTLKQLQQIPVGKVQLNIDTKLYKNEAINRQLPHAIDGLNPARRKILTASIMRFGQDTKEVKVFQLGGYVADKMLYHHGDASLNKTIITMAQSFYGARKYPYLIGVGQFGSRHGDKAGSARYISVKLSPVVNALFPPEDKWLLSYVFDEGNRAEPEYYIPILPMAVLESYQIVTEGWNHRTYGRSLTSVLNVVMDYIDNKYNLIEIADEFNKTLTIPSEIVNFYNLSIEGDIRTYKGTDYAFGNYVYDINKNSINIKELPIGLVTSSYIENISKLTQYIDRIEDYSSTNEIDIIIYLKPGAKQIIEKQYGNDIIDPIEDCFSLRISLRPNLNYYSCEKGVLEFGSMYLSNILYWAPIRKELYKKRIIRKGIIIDVQILKEESIIKYISYSNMLNISAIEDDEKACLILSNNGFPKINTGLLHNPSYTNNDELRHLLLDSEDATFDYILDLKERELTKNALQKRQDKLIKLKEEYQYIQNILVEKPFIGASIWKEEISKFIKLTMI